MITTPMLTDSYKLGHHLQYPPKTEEVYSNWTPRSDKYADDRIKKVVSFGQQYALKTIHEMFEATFFMQPKEEICGYLKDMFSAHLGSDYDVSHFEALHDLGYLPIQVKSLPEGVQVPFKTPMITIKNTLPEFYWITNFLETMLSNLLWMPMTSATTAKAYRDIFEKYAMETDPDNMWFVDYQGHDFSARGHSSFQSTMASGMGHATSFKGSDSLCVIPAVQQIYNTDNIVTNSVNATEHSVMSAGASYGGAKPDEFETFNRLLDTFPTGILSIVSDTFDLFAVITNLLPRLKDKIEARDGKVVIRPDTGLPADILCGSAYCDKDYDSMNFMTPITSMDMFKEYAWEDLQEDINEITPHGEYGGSEHQLRFKWDGKYYDVKVDNLQWNRYDKQYYFLDMYEAPNISVTEVQMTPEHKGVVELLWEIFGGTVNAQGYKVLSPKIGAIYGDSITLDRAEDICKRLKKKGFASTNVVLGIGSYTYQMVTRDTFGFAMKATSCVIDGVRKEIYKDPKTGDGMKKSLKGLVCVQLEDGEYVTYDQVTEEEEAHGELKVIYHNGCFVREETFEKIRERLCNTL